MLPYLDVDECHSGNLCHPKAHCYNTVGSYKCKCLAFYKGNGTYCEGKIPHYYRLSRPIGQFSISAKIRIFGNKRYIVWLIVLIN